MACDLNFNVRDEGLLKVTYTGKVVIPWKWKFVITGL